MSFFTYAFVNMGMVSGILPVVGVPLAVHQLRRHGHGDARAGRSGILDGHLEFEAVGAVRRKLSLFALARWIAP